MIIIIKIIERRNIEKICTMKGLYKRDFFLIHFENFSFVCIYASSCLSVLWRPLLWSVVPPNLCKLSGRKTYAAKVSGLMLWLPSED